MSAALDDNLGSSSALQDAFRALSSQPVAQAAFGAAVAALAGSLPLKQCAALVAAAARGAVQGQPEAQQGGDVRKELLTQLEDLLRALGVSTVAAGLQRLRQGGRKDLATRVRKLAAARNPLAHPDTSLSADIDAFAEHARHTEEASSEPGGASLVDSSAFELPVKDAVEQVELPEVPPFPVVPGVGDDTGAQAGKAVINGSEDKADNEPDRVNSNEAKDIAQAVMLDLKQQPDYDGQAHQISDFEMQSRDIHHTAREWQSLSPAPACTDVLDALKRQIKATAIAEAEQRLRMKNGGSPKKAWLEAGAASYKADRKGKGKKH